VQVRGQAPLGLDGGEVLHVVARTPAQVLPEPVHQLGEVQSVERRAPIVVALGVEWHALGVDPPVRRQGQREEHRRPVGLAVRRREHPSDGPFLHRQAGQLGCILAVPCRPHPTARLVLIAVELVALAVVVVGQLVLGLGVEVPTLPALLHSQAPRPLRAGRAAVLPGRSASDRYHQHLARLDIGHPGHDGPTAHPHSVRCRPDELGTRCRVHAPADQVGRAPPRLARSVTGGAAASRHGFASEGLDPAPPPVQREAART
jgi:hypothetical protein